MSKNPWLGLAAYSDEATKNGYIFCGRSIATMEMYSLVDNNIFVTLYGKSGIGKTSILQAGLFPKLRANNYFPVAIRLGVEDVSEATTYAAIAVGALQDQLERTGCIVKQSAPPLPCTAEEYLWHYFATTKFSNILGDEIYPVLVFDQFEELFFRNKKDFTLFLKQVYLLLDDSSLPTTLTDGSDLTNFRLLFSIREDDFFRLEDVVERMNLIEMKYNRYRLTEMSDIEAAEVITEPAATFISPADATEIVQRVTSVAKDEYGYINSAILSLLCCRLYDATVGAGASKIELSSVRTFLNNSGGNLLASFYDDVIKKLNDRKKWEYIEDVLVTDDGRRNSLLKSEFDKSMQNCDFLFKGEYAMLRTVTYSSGKEPHVEIIHDLLADHMKANRNERRFKAEAEKMRRRQRRNVLIIAIVAFLAAIFAYQYWSILRGHDNMLTVQSRYLASEAKKLYNESQYTKALRLALFALPEDVNSPNRPYVQEAEYMLRSADNARRLNIGVTILQHDSFVQTASFSPCGRYLVTASDSTARVWNSSTGLMACAPLKQSEYIRSMFFTTCGKYLIAASLGCTVSIWSVSDGFSLCAYIRHDDYVNTVSVSPDNRYILTASEDKTAQIWEIASGTPLFNKPLSHSSAVRSASFSPCGGYIITVSDDNIVRVWNAKTGNIVGGGLKHNETIEYASFSPCGKYIVTIANDNCVYFWDAVSYTLLRQPQKYNGRVKFHAFSSNGEYLLVKKDDMNNIQLLEIATGDSVCIPSTNRMLSNNISGKMASFSPCGNYIVTASDSSVVCIYEIDTGKPIGKPMKYNDFVNVPFACISSISFSPCGKYVLTLVADRILFVWDLKTDEHIMLPMQDNQLIDLAFFSPCGTRVVTVTSDKKVCIWDICNKTTDKPFAKCLQYGENVSYFKFLHNGKIVATKSLNNVVCLWDVATGNLIGNHLLCNDEVQDIYINPSGGCVAVKSADNYVYLWNVATGNLIGKPLRCNYDVREIYFSPCGKYVVTESREGNVCIWDVATGNDISIASLLHIDEADVKSFIFATNCQYVATISYDNAVTLWNITDIWGNITNKPVKISLTDSNVYKVKQTLFTPCGKYLVISYDDDNFYIIDTADGTSISNGYCPNAELFISSCSRFLVISSSNETRVYDIATGNLVGNTLQHDIRMRPYTFSQCGRYLIMVDDSMLYLWNIFSGKQLCEPVQSSFSIDSISNSSSKYLVSDSFIWRSIYPIQPLQELINKYRKSDENWSLSEEEIKEYCLD